MASALFAFGSCNSVEQTEANDKIFSSLLDRGFQSNFTENGNGQISVNFINHTNEPKILNKADIIISANQSIVEIHGNVVLQPDGGEFNTPIANCATSDPKAYGVVNYGYFNNTYRYRYVEFECNKTTKVSW